MKPEDLTGMMKRIYDVCQKKVLCKSSDRLLIWWIWAEDMGMFADGMTMITGHDFITKKLSNPETIRRSRQLLHQHGICLPPGKVYDARQELGEDMKHEITKIDPPPIMDYPNKNQYRMF